MSVTTPKLRIIKQKYNPIVSEISDKHNYSNIYFACRIMPDYKKRNSALAGRPGSLSRSKSDWGSFISRSMYNNTSMLSSCSSRSSASHSSRPQKLDPSKCILAFPDSETTLAAIEEPLPVIALDNITTLDELEKYWSDCI